MLKPACILILLGISSFSFGQQAPEQRTPSPGGWRRVGEPPPNQPEYSSNSATPADPGYDQGQDQSANQPAPPPNEPSYNVPPQLTIRRGTYVVVRVNQFLSSDRNQPGDAFSATLVKPLVVDGVIVAQRGQTLGGRVAEAQRAGRVEGVSRLGVQLTDLTLVDGQQVPIQSQLISRTGPTSQGRDAGAIAGATGLGAAIGAGVNGGVGAGVGAGAGAIVGVIGVLLTRGRATVIYPEQVLTFRIEAPVTVATDRASQAFRYVEPDDYDRPQDMQARMAPPPPRYGYYPPPPPYYYSGPRWYPYYWGPSIGFHFGGGLHGFGHGGGHHR